MVNHLGNIGGGGVLFNLYSFRNQKVLHINRGEAITVYFVVVLEYLQKAVKPVFLAELAFWNNYFVSDQWQNG